MIKKKLAVASSFIILIFSWCSPLSSGSINDSTEMRQNTAISLSDTSTRYRIGKSIEYLRDDTASLTIDDLLRAGQGARARGWTRSRMENPSFGFSTAAFWIRFTVVDRTAMSAPWYCVVDYPQIDRMELYGVRAGRAVTRRIAGDHYPFYQREVPYRNFAFALPELSSGQTTYYMRVSSSGSVNIPLTILSSAELVKKMGNEQLLLGLYYGLMLLIAFYNFFIYLSIRDRSYLYYILWIFGYGLYQITLNGLSFQYFWPDAVWWANNSLPLFIFLGLTACVQFGRSFLHTAKNAPAIDRVLRAYMALTVTGTGLSFVLPYDLVIRAGTFTVIIMTSTLLVAGVLCLKRGQREARFYVLAWTTLIMGIIVYALKTFGLLPEHFLTSWSQQIGSAIEVTLLSLALADRINIMQREKNAAVRETAKAQEKYRLLFEGSSDIIFTLDENWIVLSINRACRDQLRIDPAEVTGRNFLDLIHVGSDEEGVTRRLVQEKLEAFARDRKPITFKTQFALRIGSEHKDMQIWMEYIDMDGRSEILGKAKDAQDESLIRYVECEKQRLLIENYLTTAEDVSYQITRNLYRFMEPRQINLLRIAIREIIINAIEHGNLNITYEDKTRALMEDRYFEIVAERQKDPQYRDKKVEIFYSIDAERVVFRITDQGEGFDYRRILEENSRDANERMLSHGRGISMSKQVFDEIQYNRKGNQVLLVKYYN